MIDQSIVKVARECKELSLNGKITFPEVVRRLQDAGVERYHTDLARDETTFYMPNGDSHVLSHDGPREGIGEKFDSSDVEASIRAIQKGEINYVEFLTRIMAAGSVGYFVQIAGRRALYFGRNGETHLEPFPSV